VEQPWEKESHAVNCHRVTNHLFALGNAEKTCTPPLLDEKACVIRCQELHQRKMMADVDLPPNGSHCDKKVADARCGHDCIAMHVVKATGALAVAAVNVDPSQIANAKSFSTLKVARSFNCPLPFKDASFDAACNVQASSCLMDKEDLFSKI
jgi:hypothetical protein